VINFTTATIDRAVEIQEDIGLTSRLGNALHLLDVNSINGNVVDQRATYTAIQGVCYLLQNNATILSRGDQRTVLHGMARFIQERIMDAIGYCLDMSADDVAQDPHHHIAIDAGNLIRKPSPRPDEIFSTAGSIYLKVEELARAYQPPS